MAKKPAKKHVDFLEPPTVASPLPESEVSELHIEEITSEDGDPTRQEASPEREGPSVEEMTRGKVKDSITLFQKKRTEQEDAAVAAEAERRHLDDVAGEAGRGRMRQSAREAYLQRTSSQDREEAERYQRRKELEEIAKARSRSAWEEDTGLAKDTEAREAKKRELREIAAMRSQSGGWAAAEGEGEAGKLRSASTLEQARDIRSRELKEIASMRSHKNWEEEGVTEEKTSTPADTADMGGAFRNVASSWRQRERGEREAAVEAAPPKQQQPQPSRRIGNLLSRKTADEWEDPDELIAEFLKSPPIAAIPDSDEPMPPPPPRESSRDYMREFSATDKKFHK